jgi:hypothetical protein
MKKYMVILPISAMTIFISIPKGADAQFIVGSVISSTVGRVIRAIDLTETNGNIRLVAKAKRSV